MGQITRRDILGPSRYSPMRDEFRKRVIAIKKKRRVILGDRVSLVFDGRETLLYQVEEMLRADNITDEAGIAAEIAVYDAQMPRDGELSATLFIELPADADSRVELGRFIGLDEHVVLLVGEHRVKAWFEPGRQEEDKISAVQFTRYRLPPAAQQALRTAGTKVAVEITHPAYQARSELSEETRAELAKDLD
jgi:hypothetical protein